MGAAPVRGDRYDDGLQQPPEAAEAVALAVGALLGVAVAAAVGWLALRRWAR